MSTYDLTSSIPSSNSIVAGDILNCPYSGTYKTVTLPAGQYKLECWGAQGGSYSTSYTGGKGGYSQGILTLTASTTVVYVYAGGQGASSGTSTTGTLNGGYNGGGNGYSSSTTYLCSAGGGASDIRVVSNSYNGRIIVAGGGGGSASYNASYHYSGGVGGGISGGSGSQYNSSYPYGTGGTATAVGTSYYGSSYVDSSSKGTLPAFGAGGSAGTSGGVAGGGGGWYGGGYSRRASAGGGSGYVYTNSTYSNHPYYSTLGSTYYLTSATTHAGSTSFTDYSGSTVTGHSGDGACRITVVSVSQWKYTTTSITAPTYTKQTTSSITLTPATCKCYSFTPTVSGTFIAYATSSYDNYGYLCSSAPTLNTSGSPTSYLTGNDDSAYLYNGGTSNSSFGLKYDVVAGTTYYLYVKPYSTSSNTGTVTVTYWMDHPKTRVFIKTNSSTWTQITS